MLDMKLCLCLNLVLLGINLGAGEYWIAAINILAAGMAVMTLYEGGEL